MTNLNTTEKKDARKGKNKIHRVILCILTFLLVVTMILGVVISLYARYTKTHYEIIDCLEYI